MQRKKQPKCLSQQKRGPFQAFLVASKRAQTGMLSTVRVLRRADHRILSSLKSFKGFARCASTLKAPVYPSDADRELVNDEYYDIMEDGIANDLEEALAEDSPVGMRSLRNA